MITSISKHVALGLTASALVITACSKPAEDTIPAAPDAAIQTVITEFAQGNGGILWEAMPASYQTDVTTLVKLAGTKVDAEVYDKSFATIGRLAEVVDQQQAFILNTSFLKGRSAEEMAELEAALPSVVGVINTLTQSELASSTGLLNFDGQAFFDTTVSKLAGYVEELGVLAGEEYVLSDYVNSVVSVVDADDLQATLLMTVPGEEPVEQTFTKVEERWVPADMASDWASSVAEATAELEATSPEDIAAQKPQIMGVLAMMDGVLTQIAAAETQEQFDQSLQGAMMPLMGLMMMGQGMGAPAAPMPAAPSSTPSVK
ncbi:MULTISPECIES: hypothetical protein [unclassified Lentimonas]|uniref:hypothetical protein n=1 Tax=unclassified Lentimonas TaxID=2630993 RepID=UPI00132C7200|nr:MULTISPECIES: hypothetical protein [unclassified Lentimonas]CAA6677292.1 Unannotated [Lentimonas sp. CC4]CAA6686837.1 Unannotated [Lentimonas sp. CC6]CAA6691203.1 Unannotated [Lentimonas sp. CC19]CAA6694771.1 Unannotated [Lentimonas sp. CC10]CAA7071582.1 Unannotated [Lentimonas sp. CC11]